MSAAKGVRARRAAARRAGKLSADEFGCKLGAPAPLVRWRISRGEIAVDADGMIEAGELERVRAEFPCRADGCPRVALDKTRYCGSHEGLGRRGQKRTVEQRARIAAGMRGLPREGVSEIMRARWADPETRAGMLRAQHEARERAQREFGRIKAERGALDVDDVVAQLKDRGIGRSATTVAEHIRQGWLEGERVDVPSQPGRDPYLCTPEAVETYIARLQRHQDGRLRRFDDNPRFRASWYAGAHGSQAEWGRLNRELSDPRFPPGPKRKVSAQQVDEIYRRADGMGPNPRRCSVRAIAEDLELPRGRVERVLRERAKSVSRNPPTDCLAIPSAQADHQPVLPGMEGT